MSEEILISEEILVNEEYKEETPETFDESADMPEETVKTPVENPKAVVEAVLFAMGNSVEAKKLAEVLNM